MAVLTIYPYLLDDTWVFDDPRTGLKEEAFVLGMTEIISRAIEHKQIPNAPQGFAMHFSDQPFDGFDAEMTWQGRDDSQVVRGRDGSASQVFGNWYITTIAGKEMRGWLCAALGLYFRDAPRHIFVKHESIPAGVNSIWEISRQDAKAIRYVSAPTRHDSIAKLNHPVTPANATYPDQRRPQPDTLLAAPVQSNETPKGNGGAYWADRLVIMQGDITHRQVEAIVNAANNSLLDGGGVDGAIHAGAGPDLLEECRKHGWCSTGDAKLTMGYLLPAKYVLHTVGPVWTGGDTGEDESLARCYRSCFALVERHGIRSIAFPAISTGAFLYPAARACRIALVEIKQFLERNTTVERVSIVCIDRKMIECCMTVFQELTEASSPGRS